MLKNFNKRVNILLKNFMKKYKGKRKKLKFYS